jgi:hypothetical protein
MRRRIITPVLIRNNKINFLKIKPDDSPPPILEKVIYDPCHFKANPEDRPKPIVVECYPEEFWDKVCNYTKMYLHVRIDDMADNIRESEAQEAIRIYRETGILIHQQP